MPAASAGHNGSQGSRTAQLGTSPEDSNRGSESTSFSTSRHSASTRPSLSLPRKSEERERLRTSGSASYTPTCFSSFERAGSDTPCYTYHSGDTEPSPPGHEASSSRAGGSTAAERPRSSCSCGSPRAHSSTSGPPTARGSQRESWQVPPATSSSMPDLYMWRTKPDVGPYPRRSLPEVPGDLHNTWRYERLRTMKRLEMARDQLARGQLHKRRVERPQQRPDFSGLRITRSCACPLDEIPTALHLSDSLTGPLDMAARTREALAALTFR